MGWVLFSTVFLIAALRLLAKKLKRKIHALKVDCNMFKISTNHWVKIIIILLPVAVF